jgi:hypothetical protein
MTFKLLPGEINSPLWKKIEGHLKDQLESKRRANDGDLGPEKTAHTRGQIACLKNLIALGKRDQSTEPDES